MKKELGISIYPAQSSYEENINYISLAAKYNFKRIFSTILDISDNKKEQEETLDLYRKTFKFAKDKGFFITLDVSPIIYKKLSISYDEIGFFKQLNCNAIRLDEGFDGITEAKLTYNKEDIKIEVNASADTAYINNIFSFSPNRNNLIACHNHYPLNNTGLDYNYFRSSNKRYYDLQMELSAFISSQDAINGFWGQNSGLPTLEMHRNIPITTQAKHFWAIDEINYLLVGNNFPSEEELKRLSEINPYILEFEVDTFEMSDLEKKILFEYDHVYRGDYSPVMIRSTMPRITFADKKITPNNTIDIKIGDIYICNEKAGRYNAELHIAKQDIKNDGSMNLIGKIKDYEVFLMKYLKSWGRFQFKSY